MTKNKKMIAEFLRESKRIRRTLEFVSPTQETQSLLRHLDFIDETLEELGPKGKALTCLYRYHLSWENASQRLFISPNTLGLSLIHISSGRPRKPVVRRAGPHSGRYGFAGRAAAGNHGLGDRSAENGLAARKPMTILPPATAGA